jgi:hypothetical protein
MIKIWGASQPYSAYNHPFLVQTTSAPFTFKILTPLNLDEGLKTQKNIYLYIAMTVEQKLIIIDKNYENEKQIQKKQTAKFHSRTLKELSDGTNQSAVLLENYKDLLKDKKIIFDMQDNPLQGTTAFVNTMKNLGLESGDNFIFISAFDPPSKDLKTQQPTYLYGSSAPEILRIKAMESLYLIEAATFRADIIIHPLTYYKQPFFTETLMTQLEKRHKKFIIGPITEEESPAALALKPFGIIIN